MKPKLFLIDGYALIYRAYFAFGTRPLITDDGFNVSAIYGFFNSLFRLIDKEKPQYIAMALDPSGKTFRSDIYKDYKATRQKMPDDLRNSLPILFNMVEAFNLYTITMDNYEADDVIGSITQQGEDEGFETYIFSSDKDLYQLISDSVFLYDPKGEKIVDRDGVKDKFGITAEQVIDYLALMGDSSDNVPGVPKVGKKTAVDLLNQFGSMEKLYQNVDLLTKKSVKASLKENRDLADLSKTLVTIKRDLDTQFDLDKAKWGSPDVTKLKGMFQEYNMRSLSKQLEKYGDGSVDTQSEPLEKSYNPEKQKFARVDDTTQLEGFIEEKLAPLKDGDTIAIHPVEEGLNLYGLAISTKEGEATYVDLVNRDEGDLFEYNQKSIDIFTLLKPHFSRLSTIAWDLKNLMRGLDSFDITLKSDFDPLLAHYVLYSHENNHSVERIYDKVLNYRVKDIVELIGSGRKKRSFEEIGSEEIYIHICERAEGLFSMKRELNQLLDKRELQQVYGMEFNLMPILLEMELNGVLLDKPYMSDLKKEFKELIDSSKAKIIELAGEEFNPDSPKQLGVILFEKMELPHGKKGKSGSFSTDVKVLEKLKSEGVEIAVEVLKYRELTKLNSTYINGLSNLTGDDSRIRTKFNQTIAATGRLSSTEPNLQNIPIKTTKGELIRKAFIPKEGYSLVAADYSQIELRVLAHYCQDKALLDAFNNDEDIHQATASILFDMDKDEVNRELRSKAKVANFSIIYGKSKFGLSEDLQISFKEASDFIDQYFEKFKGIKGFIDAVTDEVEKKGKVKTIIGRERVIPEIRSDSKNIKNHAIRAAINTPIQGTAADILKDAMIRLDYGWKKYDANLLLQVHDELVFEVRDDKIEEFSTYIKEAMEQSSIINVPLRVNVDCGKNWLEAH